MVLKKKKLLAKQTSPRLFSDSRPCCFLEICRGASFFIMHVSRADTTSFSKGHRRRRIRFFFFSRSLSLPVANNNNNDVRLFSQAPEHLPGWKPVSLFHKSDGRCGEAKILHVCFECAMLLLSHIFMVGNKECTFPWTGDETFVAFLF